VGSRVRVGNTGATAVDWLLHAKITNNK
jgi:hypothetical protein